MNLKCLTIFLFLLINPYINNIGYCQNDKTDIQLENINGPGKPKAIVFRFDTLTKDFVGVSFFKRNKNRSVFADSLEDVVNKKKVKFILKKINRIGYALKKENDGIFSKDGKYFILVDEPDGFIKAIYFFNSQGTLLNKYKIDVPFICAYDFNAFGNYFILWGSGSSEFYFFTASGKLVRKGDFNLFTKDSGTSYWKNEISKSGKIWALINNSTFIYDRKNNLLDKIPGVDFAIIYEDLNYILYVSYHTIYVYNYQTHLIEYISTYIDCTAVNITSDKLFLLINDNDRLEYKITL